MWRQLAAPWTLWASNPGLDGGRSCRSYCTRVSDRFTLIYSWFLSLSSSHYHRYFPGSALYWFIELHLIYNDLGEINFGFARWKILLPWKFVFCITFFSGVLTQFYFYCLVSRIQSWFYLPLAICPIVSICVAWKEKSRERKKKKSRLYLALVLVIEAHERVREGEK